MAAVRTTLRINAKIGNRIKARAALIDGETTVTLAEKILAEWLERVEGKQTTTKGKKGA
jgi:hypothetical protein